MFRMIVRELTCHQPDDLGKGTTSVVPQRSHPRSHPEAAESPAKPETPNERSLHHVLPHPNQTEGCPIFAFCAKVGRDTAKATSSEQKKPLPSPHSKITLSSRPKRSAVEGPCVPHDHCGLTCHQPADLGKGTTSVVPLRSHPRSHPEAAESPAKPETPNEGSLHQVLSHPNQTEGCPIFAFCAKVGGDTAKATSSERKLPSPNSETTLSSRPKRSAVEGPCVPHDRPQTNVSPTR